MLIGIRNISIKLLIVLLQVCIQAHNPIDNKIFFLYKKCLICLLPSYVLELELGRSREIEDWVQVIIFYLYECTVVGVYINIIKTTLDSNFDFYQAFKHIKSDTLAWKQREAANLQLLFLYFLTCNLIKASKKQSSLYWYKRRSLGWA